MTIRAQKGGSAERASGIREQPCIDAIDMKSMAADWEQSQIVLIGKFVETNGAIEWLFQTPNFFVHENWQSVDEGLIEAGIVKAKELLKLSLKCVRSRPFWESIGVVVV